MKETKCYTKEKKDGGKYTTCVGFQKGDKAKPKTKIKISKEQKAKNDKTRKKILEKPKAKPKYVRPNPVRRGTYGIYMDRELNWYSITDKGEAWRGYKDNKKLLFKASTPQEAEKQLANLYNLERSGPHNYEGHNWFADETGQTPAFYSPNRLYMEENDRYSHIDEIKRGDWLPPKPKKKLKIVEKKEPRTIGSDLTGLNKKEMNVMGMLELMGRLPVELRKTILDPNVTGVKVAQETIKAENLETGDLDPDSSNYSQIEDNIGESRGYYSDYGDYLTRAEMKFYDAKHTDRDNLTEKQQVKLENIEFKIIEGISNDAYLQIEEQVELYKESIKGTSVTPKQASKGFNDWMDSNYF